MCNHWYTILSDTTSCTQLGAEYVQWRRCSYCWTLCDCSLYVTVAAYNDNEWYIRLNCIYFWITSCTRLGAACVEWGGGRGRQDGQSVAESSSRYLSSSSSSPYVSSLSPYLSFKARSQEFPLVSLSFSFLYLHLLYNHPPRIFLALNFSFRFDSIVSLLVLVTSFVYFLVLIISWLLLVLSPSLFPFSPHIPTSAI